MITPWGYVWVIASLIMIGCPTILILFASIRQLRKYTKIKDTKEIMFAIKMLVLSLLILALNIMIIVIFVVYH
jgi:O-antigen/teichoic acid export membrane protein